MRSRSTMPPIGARAKVGLALAGGGARGAYQVGVLRAIADLLPRQRHLPFPILAGASAGAITSSFLAARANDFPYAVHRLVDFWSRIRPEDVFRTDAPTLVKVAARWVTDLSLGGWVGLHREKSLLNSDPLRALLETRLDMEAVRDNVGRGALHGLALTATDYRTGFAVTFFDGAPEIATWTRSMRLGVRERLTIDHLMASSAIPMFFPAIRIKERYYADGCLRLMTPLSPAIHLGASRILAVGVRTPVKHEHGARVAGGVDAYPSVADTAGLFLNALFVESLETDIERLERINRTLSYASPPAVEGDGGTRLRRIPLLVMRPSTDLGALALDTLSRLPIFIQHLFRGLGVSGESGGDLLSYLAFDRAYTLKLLQLGYSDATAQSSALLDFLASSSAPDPMTTQA